MAFKRKSSTKSSYKKKFTKKPYTKKYAKKSFAQRVKAVVLKTCEPKDLNFSHDKLELYHNTVYPRALNNLPAMHPALGSGDSNRIGDKINASGYMLRILMGQKAGRPNVSFRWAVVEIPIGGVYSYNNWFENTTGNVLLDPLNKDYVKVIKEGTWRPNEASLAQTGSGEYTFVKKIWIPYKRTMTYGPDDGARTLTSPTRDLYWLIAPYDAYGTLIADNIAYTQMVQTLYYKDP